MLRYRTRAEPLGTADEPCVRNLSFSVKLPAKLSLYREEGGQALVLAALGMVALVAFLGLAIDAGQLRAARHTLQMHADAAALAAALEVEPCHGVHNCSAMQTAAHEALTENGVTLIVPATNCEHVDAPAAATLLVLNNPPCALLEADDHHGDAAYTEVVLTQVLPTHFAAAMGYRSVLLSTRAEAKVAASKGSQARAVLVQ